MAGWGGGERARGLNKSVPLVVGSDLGGGGRRANSGQKERERERRRFAPRSELIKIYFSAARVIQSPFTREIGAERGGPGL